MRMSAGFRSLILCVFSVGLLLGCQTAHRPPAPLPQMTIGVAQFTQPTTTVGLMAGFIPENQHLAGEQVLFQLDKLFETTLRNDTAREYTFVLTGSTGINTANYTPGRIPALEYWVKLGRSYNVDLLIVPQVLDYVERIGSDMGVTQPAHVTIDFFLIDVREGKLVTRYRFDEEQVGLASNLLEIGQFFNRGGKWLTATELAHDGMKSAIKEFGL